MQPTTHRQPAIHTCISLITIGKRGIVRLVRAVKGIVASLWKMLILHGVAQVRPVETTTFDGTTTPKGWHLTSFGCQPGDHDIPPPEPQELHNQNARGSSATADHPPVESPPEPRTPSPEPGSLPIAINGGPVLRTPPTVYDSSGEPVPPELLDEYGRLKRPKPKPRKRYKPGQGPDGPGGGWNRGLKRTTKPNPCRLIYPDLIFREKNGYYSAHAGFVRFNHNQDVPVSACGRGPSTLESNVNRGHFVPKVSPVDPRPRTSVRDHPTPKHHQPLSPAPQAPRPGYDMPELIPESPLHPIAPQFSLIPTAANKVAEAAIHRLVVNTGEGEMVTKLGLIRRTSLSMLLPLLAFTLPITLFTSCCDTSSSSMIDPPAISDDLQAELETWFDYYGRDPDDYIASLFAHHDVVILGEQHRIKHDEQFVASLLAPLHASGVTTFATEFARRSDQPLIDSLVNAPEWSSATAREIQFRQFMPWGYQDYIDILHAAWLVNHNRTPGDPALRVLGLNNTLDFSQFKTEADWEDDAVWDRVLNGQTEADWATPILTSVNADSAKVLVHCGIHHAFTGYRQPVVKDGAFVSWGRIRMGNVLRDSLGTDVVTVFLHAPWNTTAGYDADFVHPAGGRLDAFMLNRDAGPFATGFDVADSPLERLPITDAVYMHGYDRPQGLGSTSDDGVGDYIPPANDGIFSIIDFCDGWIYTKPIHEYEPVTYIDGWINDTNLDRARAEAMNPKWRTMDVDALNAGCMSYQQDFERFWGHLK